MVIVCSKGVMPVIAPLELALDEVAKAIKQKALWILKQQRFFEQFLPLTPPRQYRSSETHHYLGRQYRLKLLQGEKTVWLVVGFLEVTLPEPVPDLVGQVLQAWYRQRADTHFRRIMAEVLPSFESYTNTASET